MGSRSYHLRVHGVIFLNEQLYLKISCPKCNADTIVEADTWGNERDGARAIELHVWCKEDNSRPCDWADRITVHFADRSVEWQDEWVVVIE